jgi:hypothetical protein
MRKYPFYIIIFALGVCILGTTPSLKKTFQVKAEDLKVWVSYISSDEMRGRENGSNEMKTTADWLAGKFKEFGLKPVLPNENYIQDYSYTSRQRTVYERNVIGLIEGTDPSLKDQYIFVTAHFDHIGIRKGNTPDSVYNGADDNAAGTCTLLGVAKTIIDSGLKTGRTIIFAAFSGEENGMRGSRNFVANSPVLLKNAYADINFEMTGHSEYLGRNRYYMTGCRISNLDDLIGEYNKNSEWQLVDTISVANELFYASDNIAFSRISTSDTIKQGIPSATFATTALADYIHSPFDEEKLFDYENMAGLVNYFTGLIVWLSDNKTEIQFTDPGFSKIK